MTRKVLKIQFEPLHNTQSAVLSRSPHRDRCWHTVFGPLHTLAVLVGVSILLDFITQLRRF